MDELPPYPSGWFAIAMSSELPPRAVRRVTFAGSRFVLFRTGSGEPVLMDAYCPHLGASLGHGGRVVGETLECPFHAFRFDTAGRCVLTPYGTDPPPSAVAQVHPVREVNGVLLAWRGPARPSWEVPAPPRSGWGSLRYRRWRLRGHPQEVTENSVDLGHFSVVHRYSGVEVIEPATAKGPLLTARYAMTRPGALLGRPVRFEIDVAVHGLGYSTVDVLVADAGVRARLFVLPVPLAKGFVDLRVAMQLHDEVHPGAINPLLSVLPARLYRTILAPFIFRGFTTDVQQDFRIWKHKRFVRPPALAEGDGPIGLYRRWARQFYTE